MRKSSATFIKAAICVLMVVILIRTYDTKRYDDELSEMCERDGGLATYESVRLPSEKFDSRAQIILDENGVVGDLVDGQYMGEAETTYLIGGSTMEQSAYTLTTKKIVYRVTRKSDKKVMGSATLYS